VSGIIAITGATGFIGACLSEHFRRLGWEVRALVRRTAEYPWKVEGVRPFLCDLPDALDESSLDGARVVVHCAYMTRFTDIEEARRVNDLGTRRVLDRARKAGVHRFLFLSSQSAHEDAESYYGRSKLALEKLLEPDRDLIFRSGLVLGKSGSGLFHRMCDMIRRSRVVPLFGGGRQPIQTIHVEDLCLAVEAALRKELTGLFTIAAPRALEMRELLREIAVRLGRRPLLVPFPLGPTLLVLRALERMRIPFPVSSENLLGLKCLRATDTSRGLDTLGINARGTAESLDDVLA
jgi:NADH dehydrogenase